jgi:hypothetical protein
MPTDITSEHAEYNAQVLKENQAYFEEKCGFEDPVTGNNGWIAPDGKLWPVPHTGHREFCDLWLGEPESVVEQTYVKLSDGVAYWFGKRLTPKQKKTLFHYGYDPEGVEKEGTVHREDYG